jgi:hypothetical protein
MPDFLDDFYDNCMSNAPAAGHAIGYLSGGVAAAPFAAAVGAETSIPAAWGWGQVSTLAVGAAAFDIGKEVGTTAGTELAEALCGLTYEIGQNTATAYQQAHDYFTEPPAEAGKDAPQSAHFDWAAAANDTAATVHDWPSNPDLVPSLGATHTINAPLFAASPFDFGPTGLGDNGGHAGDSFAGSAGGDTSAGGNAADGSL